MIDLFERSTEMLRWFEDTAGKMYLEYLRERIRSLSAKLRREKDLTTIYTIQGELNGLEYAADVPDEIKRLLADKAAGKRV